MSDRRDRGGPGHGGAHGARAGRGAPNAPGAPRGAAAPQGGRRLIRQEHYVPHGSSLTNPGGAGWDTDRERRHARDVAQRSVRESHAARAAADRRRPADAPRTQPSPNGRHAAPDHPPVRRTSQVRGQGAPAPGRAAASPRAHRTGYSPAQLRRARAKALGIAAVAMAVVVAVVWFVARSGPVSILVNGADVQLDGPMTVAQAAALNSAGVQPGDYVVVDGSVLVEGGGNPYDVTLNGQRCQGDALQTVLRQGDVLGISNGSDIMESADQTESVTPCNVSITGTGQFAKLVTPGVDGRERVLTGKESGKVARQSVAKPTTAVVRRFLPGQQAGLVALTFDDGPGACTQQVLDILAQHGAKATFFVDGKAALENPAMVKAMADAGHQVAIHAYENRDLTKFSDTELVESFTKTRDAIKEAAGVDTGVMRAPFMSFADREWRLLGPQVTLLVGASIDSRDINLPGADEIVSRVVDNADAGDIVQFHDGGAEDLSQTVEALPAVLEGLASKGLTTATIDELLAASQVPTE